jgi:hypothetical protein
MKPPLPKPDAPTDVDPSYLEARRVLLTHSLLSRRMGPPSFSLVHRPSTSGLATAILQSRRTQPTVT